MDVIVVKMFGNKVRKQRMKKSSWDGIGPDKNGWVLESEQSIGNDVPKGQQVKNDVQVLAEKAKKEAEERAILEEKKRQEAIAAAASQGNKEEFMKAVSGLTKGTIKDYFDGCNPPVKYANAAKVETLHAQLGEHLKYNVVELQKIFS